MVRVLDTAALLHWPPAQLAGGVCAHSQRSELEQLSHARALLVDTADLEWRAVSVDARAQAKVCAEATGDFARLSDVDIDVLALALEVEAVLVTDDYRLQNCYKHAGVRWNPLRTLLPSTFGFGSSAARVAEPLPPSLMRCTGRRKVSWAIAQSAVRLWKSSANGAEFTRFRRRLAAPQAP